MKPLLVLCVLMSLAAKGVACINDAFSSPSARVALVGRAAEALHEAVHGKLPPGPSKGEVKNKLIELLADPHPLDVAWANETAGAHLRLGEPQKAADVLEPLREKFSGNYALHANLGTAYHLLGRYEEAAEEIARDVEIDPGAHEGLEVYHLALLQYLSQPTEWQERHLFIDEWSDAWNELLSDKVFPTRLTPAPHTLSEGRFYVHSKLRQDQRPAYRTAMMLANDRQIAGTAYMLGLNQNQPSCFVMAGFLALAQRDGDLAKEAFDRAIDLKSPQSAALRSLMKEIDRQKRAHSYDQTSGASRTLFIWVMVGLAGLLLFYLARKVWECLP